MTLFGACTLRRLLSNTRTWPSAHLFQTTTPGTTSPKTSLKRHHSTIFSKPKNRPIDAHALENFIETLTYVLRRYVGREHGLENRDDDYVSLKLLLNYPEFRSMDMPRLQKMVDNDFNHRFDIRFDPTMGEDCWWIRAKRWNEPHFFLKPIKAANAPAQVVYQTTLSEWNSHISRNGIPRLHEEYIRFECGIRTDNYIDNLQDQNQVFIFLDVPRCLESGIRFFTPLPTPQPLAKPTHLLTKGNDWGYIPSRLFAQVDMVQAKKTLLWGDPQPISQVPYILQPEDAYRHGERRTLLQTLGRDLHGFADFAKMQDKESTMVDSQTMEEAKAVLEIP
ncbi:hypothetical protein BDZ97DRAFT_1917660 [Flammula alnicola]|nr:hypothetical protein BDZ97DRAFT_1917660 [Flammula alnicola]